MLLRLFDDSRLIGQYLKLSLPPSLSESVIQEIFGPCKNNLITWWHDANNMEYVEETQNIPGPLWNLPLCYQSIIFFINQLTKLTRGVCRGLHCYAASPEKLFSFLEKNDMGLPGWCNITRWSL